MQGLKIGVKFIASVAVVLLLTLGATAWCLLEHGQRSVEAEACQRAQTVLGFQDACREYVRTTLSPAVRKHADELVLEARSATVMTRGVFDAFERRMPEYSFREVALRPRNPASTADKEEAEAIERFRQDEDLKEASGFRRRNGREEFYVARPLVVKSACLECHGEPAAAPRAIIDAYGPERGFGWQEGDVAGLVLVAASTDDLRARQAEIFWFISGAFGVVAVVLMVFIPFVFRRLVTRRLQAIAAAMEHATSTGDLGRRIDDRSGDEIGRLGGVFDAMAAQFAAEKKKVAAQNQTLSAQVEERTRHLEEAMQKIEQSSAQKTRFLASMSHEIRTPIGAVLGYAELLDEPGDIPEDRRQAVQAIRRNGQHLLELINDILDLSKIEAGSFEMEQVDCSLNQIVKDVLSVMSARAQSKGLQLAEVYLTAVPERIVSDPTRIRQVLINLVGNAVKFTEHGMVTVSLSFTQTGSHRGSLEFRVQDTGIGIPADKLDLLFKPFQQLDASVSRKFGGTGLGLAISKEIARLLGGELGVRSEVGLGSVFTLKIHCDFPPGTPLHKRPSAAVLAEAGKKKVGTDSRRGVRIVSGSVLVVDDGADNRKLFRYHVEGAGAEVSIAENGEEAVQRAAAAPFDLILMDIQMPRMDGFEALREIRALGIKTPVIALTAHAMKGDREKCMQAGFDDYLSKPVSRASLIEKLAAFLPPPEGSEPAVAPSVEKLSPQS